MPLYELRVMRPDGTAETRYTDVRPQVGEFIRVDGRPVQVVSRHEDPQSHVADARFTCVYRQAPAS